MSIELNYRNDSSIPSPGQRDLFSAAGKDIQLTIASLCEIKVVAALSQTCKKFYEVLKEEGLWAFFAKKLEIHLSGNGIHPKDDIRAFRALKKAGHALHIEFASWVGAENFANVPVLDFSRIARGAIMNIKVENLSAPVMRGVDIHLLPVITFRCSYQNKKSGLILYQPYCSYKFYWSAFSAEDTQLFPYLEISKDQHLEYFIRLFKNLPCGVYQYDSVSRAFNDEPRTTPDGKSIVELV